jgi:hypothetical protein
MKMEQTQCSETSAIKHHTLENNPKGYTRHTEHGESLKSRILVFVLHQKAESLLPERKFVGKETYTTLKNNINLNYIYIYKDSARTAQ